VCPEFRLMQSIARVRIELIFFGYVVVEFNLILRHVIVPLG
jgi:hypothetical protein